MSTQLSPSTDATPSTSTRRTPLRSRPWRDLNRESWSQGRTVYELHRGQRNGIHKPVEEMTVAELRRTQYDELETESRRSFYATGNGVLSLDALSIERDAARYGTPYEQLDPTTAKQIDWEQRAYYSGPCIRVRVEDGRLLLHRYVDRATFEKLRRRAADYRLNGGTGRRYRLTRDALREARRRSWQTLRAAERDARELADDTWHRPPRRGHDPIELELGFNLIADPDLEALLGEEADPPTD